jgi:hypothetical protein
MASLVNISIAGTLLNLANLVLQQRHHLTALSAAGVPVCCDV